MTEIVVVHAGTEIKVEMYRGLYADSDASSECYDSEERRWREHGDEPGTSASSDSDDGSDDVSTSGGCLETQNRPRELKEQSQAGWHFNMVVIDKKVSEWEGASYTNTATESGSSSTITQVESSVESKATEVERSQAQPECVGTDLAQRSENQESDGTVRSSSKNDNHKLCAEVHQALCDAIAPERDAGQICGLHAPPCSCGVLAEWLRTPLSLASTGRGEVLGDFCIEMSKVIEEHLDGKSSVDGYFMYEAPRLDVTSKDFKANVEEVVSALVQVRDEARETCRSPVGDSDRGSSQWCPASPYYAPNDDASTSCYGNRSETISEHSTSSASAEASAPEVRRTAQRAQSPEIEAATDDITPVKFVHVMDMDYGPVKAKQQKKVRSPYFKSSVHTGGYEPQWSEGAVFGSAHGPHPQAKSDDVQHSERGPIYIYSDDVQHSEQGSIYHFDMPAAGGELVARYTDECRIRRNLGRRRRKEASDRRQPSVGCNEAGLRGQA